MYIICLIINIEQNINIIIIIPTDFMIIIIFILLFYQVTYRIQLFILLRYFVWFSAFHKQFRYNTVTRCIFTRYGWWIGSFLEISFFNGIRFRVIYSVCIF